MVVVCPPFELKQNLVIFMNERRYQNQILYGLDNFFIRIEFFSNLLVTAYLKKNTLLKILTKGIIGI